MLLARTSNWAASNLRWTACPKPQRHLERALALSPNVPRAHLLLGKVYQRQGKIQAAEEHLRLGAQTAR